MRKFIVMPLCGVIARFPEAFVAVTGSAIMLGAGLVLRFYGLEAFLAVMAAIVVLSLLILKYQSAPLPDMSGPPEPIMPPELPGPDVRLSMDRLGRIAVGSLSGIKTDHQIQSRFDDCRHNSNPSFLAD